MKPIKIRRKASKNPLTQPLLWAALALTPTAVYADCTQDSDCADGEICESNPISSAECFIDENGEEICTEEEMIETIGYCTDAPINCVQDSDCPSHLRCEGLEGVTSSPGDPGEPPPPSPDQDGDGFAPDPDADQIEEEPEDVPAMCVYIPAECETDDDCGENFHCETYTYEVGCTMPVPVECEEGEDCPPVEDFDEDDCGEEEFSEGFCEPNEIECDSDEACPADWRCREMTELVCDGENDDISIGGEPREGSGAFADDAEPEDENPTVTVECQELSRDVCVPVGLDYVEISGGEVTDPTITADPDGETNDGDGSGSAPGTDGGDDNDTDTDTDNDDDTDTDTDTDTPSENSGGDVEESSCSASSRGASPWTLFGLLALLGFRRRIAAS